MELEIDGNEQELLLKLEGIKETNHHHTFPTRVIACLQKSSGVEVRSSTDKPLTDRSKTVNSSIGQFTNGIFHQLDSTPTVKSSTGLFANGTF